MELIIFYLTQGARVYRAYLDRLSKDAGLQNHQGCGLADFLLLLDTYMVRWVASEPLYLTTDDLALLLHTSVESIPKRLMALVKAGLLAYRTLEADVYEITIFTPEQFLPQEQDPSHAYWTLSPQMLSKLDHLTVGHWHSQMDCLLDLWLHAIWNVPQHPFSLIAPTFWTKDTCNADGWVSLFKLAERWGINATLSYDILTRLCHYAENYYADGQGYLIIPRYVLYPRTGARRSPEECRKRLHAVMEEVRHER